MNPFEYLLTLASVILGLAISDLAISLHRLIGAGKRVRWDYLAPMAAILAFEHITSQWWTWYGASQIAQEITFAMFFGVLISAVLLFLLAAAAFPDEIGEPVIDLGVYYKKIHRRYWLLFSAHWLLMNGISIWLALRFNSGPVHVMSPLFLIPVISLALAFIPNRIVQTAGLAGFLILYSWVYFGRTLS